MVAAIAFSAILTLCSQPADFWRDPTIAIRGDGLSIHAPTNHTFEFFLGRGALAYLAAVLAYTTAAFVGVSLLPSTLGLVATIAAILAHGYGASHWFATRWHLGVGLSAVTSGVVLGMLLAFAVLPASPDPRSVVRRWRWIMVGSLFVDFANTLIGQPAGFWHTPAAMHDGNTLVQVFLGRGWTYYLGLDLALAIGQIALITILPVPAALVLVFVFILANFAGASNWFFYEWRLGWVTPIAYGVLLSAMMVVSALRNHPSRRLRPNVPEHVA